MLQQEDGAVNDRVPTWPVGLVDQSGVEVRERKDWVYSYLLRLL